MRRVLNSVLAFMEEPNSTDSLVIAATNHVESLDRALARRFDEVVEYSLPTPSEAKALASMEPDLEGLSQAELDRVAAAAIKDAILEGRDRVSVEVLRAGLRERRDVRERFQG